MQGRGSGYKARLPIDGDGFPFAPGSEAGVFVVEPRPLAVAGSYRTVEARSSRSVQ